MSFDKEIGFFPSKYPEHLDFLYRLGIEPNLLDLKKILPPGCKEPEPKLLLDRSKCFQNIRAIFSSGANSLLIPGQMYEDKLPLSSILLDTLQNGFPTAKLSKSHHSLRLRFETCIKTGRVTQRDFNEKTSMAASEIIGGCADRDERESELEEHETNKQGYEQFLKKYRDMGNPSFCDDIPFEDLSVLSGYIAARTEYGFGVKHPKYPVLILFEASEDRFNTLQSDMTSVTAELQEFEFEPKQIWGRLPDFAQSPEGFRLFLYSFMTEIRDHLDMRVQGSYINMKSKAEIAKDHLASLYGFENTTLDKVGLTAYYKNIIPLGYNNTFVPEQWALMCGRPLEETLGDARMSIAQIGARLHNEKMRFNENAIKPDASAIGHGHEIIEHNDNMRRAAKPVVAYR